MLVGAGRRGGCVGQSCNWRGRNTRTACQCQTSSTHTRDRRAPGLRGSAGWAAPKQNHQIRRVHFLGMEDKRQFSLTVAWRGGLSEIQVISGGKTDARLKGLETDDHRFTTAETDGHWSTTTFTKDFITELADHFDEVDHTCAGLACFHPDCYQDFLDLELLCMCA